MKLLVSAAVFALTTLATAAHAGEPIPQVASSKDETRLFAGLNWTFGKSGSGVATRVGAIYTDTNSNDNLHGGRIFIDYPLFKKGAAPSLFVTGFTGTTDSVGELGFGYNFGSREMFGQIGGLVSHFEFGGNYGFSGSGLSGYLGVTSFEFDTVPFNFSGFN